MIVHMQSTSAMRMNENAWRTDIPQLCIAVVWSTCVFKQPPCMHHHRMSLTLLEAQWHVWAAFLYALMCFNNVGKNVMTLAKMLYDIGKNVMTLAKTLCTKGGGRHACPNPELEASTFAMTPTYEARATSSQHSVRRKASCCHSSVWGSNLIDCSARSTSSSRPGLSNYSCCCFRPPLRVKCEYVTSHPNIYIMLYVSTPKPSASKWLPYKRAEHIALT